MVSSGGIRGNEAMPEGRSRPQPNEWHGVFVGVRVCAGTDTYMTFT